MTILSDRLATVRPSQTKAMAARAAELRAEGRDIISLSLGEPDFDTPESVCNAGVDAIRNGCTRYTPVAGIPELREAVVQKFKRDNELDFRIEQITVGSGAKQVLFNALLATLNPGDEVAFATPCWTSYPEMVRLAGGVPVPVDCSGEGFLLSDRALDAALTPKAKWLLLNSPANPTGAVYTHDRLQSLARILRKHESVWVLCDDIYEHLVYDGTRFATMAQVAPDLADRILTVNGVSKAYAMTGWRLGYGAGPEALIKAINLVQSQSTSHASSIAQHAAVAALTGGDTAVRQFVDAFSERRNAVLARLAGIPGLECAVPPSGAFYLFPSCAELIGTRTPDGKAILNDGDLVDYLLEAAEVAVMPGAAFFASPYIRLSYAASVERLDHAMTRIERACAQLQQPAAHGVAV